MKPKITAAIERARERYIAEEFVDNIASEEIDAYDADKAKIVNGFSAPTTLVVASGEITVSTTKKFLFHKVDTEGGAAADNLTVINGGRVGTLLALMDVSAARQVTLVDGANINISGNKLLLHDSVRGILICLSPGVWTRFGQWI